MMRFLLCTLSLLALLQGHVLGQGRLEQIRQQTDSPDDKKSNGKSGDSTSTSTDDEDSLAAALFGPIFEGIITAPFKAHRSALGDDLEVPGYFPKMPYPKGYPGYMWIGRLPQHVENPELEMQMEKSRTVSFRASVEEGNDFSGMNRIGLRVTFETTSRFGIQSNWNFLNESLGGGRHDWTTIGDSYLTFRFAQNEQTQFYGGLGGRILTDPCSTRFGFGAIYGFDYFPVKPLVWSASIDAGWLGSAGVVHGRTSIGATIEHFELFAGYDFLRIGSVNIQGPMIGLKFWY